MPKKELLAVFERDIMLKKPSSGFPKNLKDWLGQKKIEEVECVISDIAGVVRGKAMPLTKFDRLENVHMPSSVFYQTISGDYVDLPIINQWTENDMILTPDISTAICSPWADDITVQVICDVLDLDGNPIEVVPRNVLKKVIGLFQQKGWDPVVAPEIEFYLTKPNIDPSLAIEPMLGRTGRKLASRQAYSMTAVDEYGRVIDDIYDFAEAQGFEIDTINQEGGAGQIEINLVHGDPLKLADQVFFFKRTIREAALKHNCFATFMAKPMQEEPGSAMHIHQSIRDLESGQNIFVNKKGDPSKYFYNFLAGQQVYLPKAICLLAPYVNSYRRYVATGSAPINLEWARDNRTTGLRIPISSSNDLRIENRVGGMDCNPYLGIAASLACGLLGIKKKLKPREELKGEAYTMPRALPHGIIEGLEIFNEAPELETVLGKSFCSIYKSLKRHEAESFSQVISPWEREHLLLNV